MPTPNWISRTALLAIAGLVAACQADRGNEAGAIAEANDAAPALPPLPVAEPPLDRSALLLATARTASAAALGTDDSAEQRRLDGKRFEVRIRFGCMAAEQPRAGPPAVAPFTVRFDADERTLRIRAAPDLSLADPSVASLAGEQAEAVEGFWMYRPWLLSDGCPIAPPPPAAEPSEPSTAKTAPARPAATPQRVGIAQVFTSADSRLSRRDHRAYEATKVLGADERPSPNGYNLVLSGRLRKLPPGRVIGCRVTGPYTPPECVLSAQFDRVWIEVPGSGTLLAEWRS